MARRPRQVFAKERDAIRSRGGMVRMSDALRLGISRKTFYAMRDASVLEQLGSRLFRLRDLPPLGSPDLVTVATRVPQGVICLVSALSFHELRNPSSDLNPVAVVTPTPPRRPVLLVLRRD